MKTFESELAKELDSFRITFLTLFVISLVAVAVVFIIACITGREDANVAFWTGMLIAVILEAGWIIFRQLRDAAERDYKKLKEETK